MANRRLRAPESQRPSILIPTDQDRERIGGGEGGASVTTSPPRPRPPAPAHTLQTSRACPAENIENIVGRCFEFIHCETSLIPTPMPPEPPAPGVEHDAGGCTLNPSTGNRGEAGGGGGGRLGIGFPSDAHCGEKM